MCGSIHEKNFNFRFQGCEVVLFGQGYLQLSFSYSSIALRRYHNQGNFSKIIFNWSMFTVAKCEAMIIIAGVYVDRLT